MFSTCKFSQKIARFFLLGSSNVAKNVKDALNIFYFHILV
jgi:hypothetical protein